MRERTMRTAGWIAAAATLLLGLAPASAQMRPVRRAMHAERGATVAVAPLLAPDLGEAWGRARAADRYRDGALEREVKVWAMGLEPGASYEVRIDGLSLATVVADAAGFFELELESPEDGTTPPVPAELPPADLLERAEVLDGTGAVVLEGTFRGMRMGDGGPSVYEERVPLADQTGGYAHGMAKVERDAGGKQEFETRGGGLLPAERYRVVVDGFEAGIVTTDATGFAALKLEDPAGDDGAPLPPELQPVEDLRVVEWRSLDDTVVLSGAFTGVSQGGEDGRGEHDSESVHGMITAFTADGFEISSWLGTFQVIVTTDTVFEGVSGLDGLSVGDPVEVEGAVDGSTITAGRVELKRHRGDDGRGDGGMDHESLRGHVAAVTGDGFTLDSGMGTFQVIVTADTVFEGVSGLDGLSVGDAVEVEGAVDGSTITADRVELMDGMGGGGGGHR